MRSHAMLRAAAGKTVRSSTPKTLAWRSGSWQSVQNGGLGNTPDAHRTFGSWRGRPETIAHSYANSSAWSDIDNPPSLATYEGSEFTGPAFLLSVAMFPSGQGCSLALGASGAYNSHFSTLASNLVAKGFGASPLRIGWEFNLTSFGWYATGDSTHAADYRGTFQQIVTTMRNAGWQGKSLWCPNAGGPHTGEVDPTLCYPGDNYVDVIGVDAYDFHYGAAYADQAAADADASNRWANFVLDNGGYGLTFWSDFCKAGTQRLDSSSGAGVLTTATAAKTFAVPEWNTANLAWQGGGAGGDDPYYFAHMYSFLTALPASAGVNVEFECLFEEDYGGTSGPNHVIYPTGLDPKPRAAAQYQTSWGQ